MKIIKTISLVFLLSIICSISGVKANGTYLSFANITINAFGGTYSTGNYDKNTSTLQTIETTDMTATMKARTYATLTPSGPSSYVTLAKNKSKNWGSENNAPNQYKLQITCTSYNLLNESYWGTWKYNWPS